jgi:hypothetical protein
MTWILINQVPMTWIVKDNDGIWVGMIQACVAEDESEGLLYEGFLDTMSHATPIGLFRVLEDAAEAIGAVADADRLVRSAKALGHLRRIVDNSDPSRSET